jgi:kinetochore protein NDC80
LNAEYDHLKTAVDNQHLSAEEVHRMNVETQTLTESIRDIKSKIQALVAASYEHEIQSAKRSDEIDRLTKAYMELAYKIGLMGQKAKGLENVDFDIDIDLGATDLTQVQITGAIMKERIRPALQAYGDRIRSECQQQTNVSISLDDEHDRLASTVDSRKETVKTLEVKFKIANDYADEAKQVRDTVMRSLLLRPVHSTIHFGLTEAAGRDTRYAAEGGQAGVGRERDVDVKSAGPIGHRV